MTLDELRRRVDKLDDALLTAVIARGELVQLIQQQKQVEGLRRRTALREQQIIGRIQAQARQAGCWYDDAALAGLWHALFQQMERIDEPDSLTV